MLFPVIPARVHGIIDYCMGLLLIACPWILGFADNAAARDIPVFLGVGMLIYSLLTDYPLGAWRKIPLFIHLWLDVFAGALLAASPFLLGFSHRVHWPHIALGVAEVGVALITSNPLTLAARQNDHDRDMRPGMA